MDQWILSFTNSLIAFVSKEMKEYHLYTVVSPLVNYFDTLTNTYIRLNRSRIKGTTKMVNSKEDQLLAISTLIHVILQITRLMAPFTPFFSEYMWQKLKNLVYLNILILETRIQKSFKIILAKVRKFRPQITPLLF